MKISTLNQWIMFEGNKMGIEGAKIIGELLKVNKSIDSIDLCNSCKI